MEEQSTDKTAKRFGRWRILYFFMITGLFLFVVWKLMAPPNNRVIVSRETTYFTEPLDEDGNVLFDEAVDAIYSEGVTPDNNAMTLLYPVLRYYKYRPESEREEELLHKIGLSREELNSNANLEFIRLDDFATDLRNSGVTFEELLADVQEKSIDDLIGNNSVALYHLQYIACARPWTAEEFPRLADWLEQNRQGLDQCVEASQRERMYFPYLHQWDADEIHVEPLDDLSNILNALTARAYLRMNEGRTGSAMADLIAVERLSEMIAVQPNPMGNYASHHMMDKRISQFRLLANYGEGQATIRERHRQLRDVDSLSLVDPLQTLASRAFFISLIARYGNNPQDFTDDYFIWGSDVSTSFWANHTDWIAVLRRLNDEYDARDAALNLPTWKERSDALASIHYSVSSMQEPTLRERLTGNSTELATQEVGSVYSESALRLCGYHNYFPDVIHLEMLRTAYALAVFQLDHGEYPGSLSDLSPEYLPMPPLDPFSGGSFVYTRIEDGYTLRSSGIDGVMDGHGIENADLIEGSGGPFDQAFPLSDDIVYIMPEPEK
jgi:hypothetical protein